MKSNLTIFFYADSVFFLASKLLKSTSQVCLTENSYLEMRDFFFFFLVLRKLSKDAKIYE